MLLSLHSQSPTAASKLNTLKVEQFKKIVVVLLAAPEINFLVVLVFLDRPL